MANAASVKEEPFCIRIHKLNKIHDNLINIPECKTKLQNLPLAKYYTTRIRKSFDFSETIRMATQNDVVVAKTKSTIQ